MGRNYFERDDGAQNTLVFQVKIIYFRRNTSVKSVAGTLIYALDVWKSKGASDQNLHYSVNNGIVMTKLIRPTHVVLGVGEYFIQDSSKVIANTSIVNIYIIYKLSPKSINTTNALKNCLFGVVDADRPNNAKDLHKLPFLDTVLSSITQVYSHILRVI